MGIVCVTAVRMGSSRLPGKTLIDVDGRPLLGHLLDRLRASESLDELVVATTDLYTGKVYSIRTGPIAPAVTASCALPGLVRQ